MHPQESADGPDVMIPKRLLDHAKLGGFTFQRPAWSSARPPVSTPKPPRAAGRQWAGGESRWADTGLAKRVG